MRVATYNLYLGADLSLVLGTRDPAELAGNIEAVQRQLATTAFPLRVDALARLLARERLDLVGLQEACLWHTDDRPLWDYVGQLLASLERLGEPFELVCTQPTFRGGGEVAGGGRRLRLDLTGDNTVLRRRSSPVRVVQTSTGMFGSAYAVTTLGTLEATIDRGWCAARCVAADAPGTDFVFVNTHTEAHDEVSRNVQRDELLATIDDAEQRVVLVGDFNADPDRVGMPDGFHDAWLAAGHPSSGPEAATCCQAGDLSNPGSMLFERIDYVWVRGGRVVDAHRIGADPKDRTAEGLWPSDHAGVVAEIELPSV